MGFGDKDFSLTGIPFIIGSGEAEITTGVKGYIPAPFAGVIEAVELVADQSGDIVIDIWKDTYANFPPTDADSITASTPPTLSSEQKSQDETLTDWTTQVNEGDWFGFNVDSVSTVQQVTMMIYIRR